jgi:Phage tail lysozyme
MVKSIINVEVNDTQFVNFMGTFNKYKEELKKTPKIWGEVDDEVVALGVAVGSLAQSLNAQSEIMKNLLSSQQKRTRAVTETADVEKKATKEKSSAVSKVTQEEKDAAAAKKKALKDQTSEEKKALKDIADAEKKAAKEKADAEKKALAERKQAMKDTKETVDSVFGSLLKLGKWAFLGGAAGLAADALGMFGLDKLIHSYTDDSRSAQGFGITTGQFQALNINLQRYMDVNTSLENIAEIRSKPGNWWMQNTLGMKPGEDNAKWLEDAAIRARRLYISSHGNEALLDAMGATNVFSMDRIRALASPETDEKSIRASFEKARVDAAPGGRLYVDPKVGEKWKDFTAVLDSMTTHLKDVVVTDLASFEPVLKTKVIPALEHLADVILKNIDWDALAAGLDRFATYIDSKQFQADFQKFIDQTGELVNRLARLLQLLDLLPDPNNPDKDSKDTTPAPGTPGAPPGLGGGDRTAKGGYWTYGLFGGKHWHPPDNPFFDEVAAKLGQLTGADTTKGSQVATHLMHDLGMSKEGAAGAIGNLLHEDPSLKAMNEKHPLIPGSRGGYGWAQWTGTRRDEFEDWSKKHNLDVSSDAANYGFLVYDLKAHFSALLKRMQHESTQQAAEDFYHTYEAPKKTDTTLGSRQATAMKIAVAVSSNGPSIAAQANAAGR